MRHVLRGYAPLGSGAGTSLMAPKPSLMDVVSIVPVVLLSVARSAALPCPLANLPRMPSMVVANAERVPAQSSALTMSPNASSASGTLEGELLEQVQAYWSRESTDVEGAGSTEEDVT
jgi:hypothetical protein